jgi:peptide/nickel transport system substrate-binding protein
MTKSTRSRHVRALLAILVAFGLVAAACGDDDAGTGTPTTAAGGTTTSGAPATPQAGGSATLLLFSEIATLDPVKATGSGGSDGMRFHALYGGLITYDAESAKVVPLQAASFGPKGTDFANWQLVLKPNLKFSDGTPFNAEAVKANWERANVPENACPCRGVAATIASMAVVNDTTLDITLRGPNAHFDKGVSRVSLNYIASGKAIADKVDLTSKPVGAGPFLLEQWIRDDRMVMNKNPDWLGGAAKAYLDKLTFRVVGDEEQRIDTFGRNQADGFYTATRSSVDRGTSAVKDSKYVSVDVTQGQTYVFNTAAAPFDDLRVRKAFWQGVDWAALAETVFGKGAKPAVNFTNEGSPWFTAKGAMPKYDPAEAQRLIDAYVAEKGGPIKFTMLTFQQTLDQARAKFIQTSLNQLKNIQPEIQVNDSPTNIGKVLRGEHQVSSWGFPTLDPDPGLFNAAKGGLPTNYSKYNNPAVNKALDDARLSNDQATRKQLYDSVWEALARDLPYLPYVVTTNGYVLSPKLQGGKVYEDGILRVDLLWMKP